MKPKQIEENLTELAEAVYDEREKETGAGNMRMLERLVMLRIIDTLWIEHLTRMEDMRQGIGLEAVSQRDPLVAYKTKGHESFQDLTAAIRHDVAHAIYHVKIERQGQAAPELAPSPMAKAAINRGDSGKVRAAKVGGRKVGRNDPCPCGSGKKYKHCCGK